MVKRVVGFSKRIVESPNCEVRNRYTYRMRQVGYGVSKVALYRLGFI